MGWTRKDGGARKASCSSSSSNRRRLTRARLTDHVQSPCPLLLLPLSGSFGRRISLKVPESRLLQPQGVHGEQEGGRSFPFVCLPVWWSLGT